MLYGQREQLEADVAALGEELRTRRLEHSRQIETERARADEEIAAERDGLAEGRRALLRLKTEVDAAQADAEDAHRSVDRRARQLAAQKVADLEEELASSRRQLDQVGKDRVGLREQLAEREEADRRFEGRTPEDIARELTTLREQCRAFERELAERPSERQVECLQKRLRDLESERVELLDRIGKLEHAKARLERQQVGVWELETLRDQKEALEVHNRALKQAFEELRADVEKLSEARVDRLAFPALVRIDQALETQATPGQCVTRIRDLEELADELRHRMAWFPTAFDPDTDKRLYYSSRDIRAFLGGLAASRLHVLQGPSGTGKTSLPRAFAWALGAGISVVSVQAGWRERADLLGYFNAFEKQFYETPFLEALYEAQAPRYQSLPYLVVLDKLNLSRPEQYFADFLSLLERADAPDPISLIPTPPGGERPRLLADGHRLRLPPNVWFIGTANKDETTLELAPKTYDRAHVMELPAKSARFDAKRIEAKLPHQLRALQAAFDDAAGRHQGDADQVRAFLTGKVRDTLVERFDIHWGNRLEQHARRFVPVVVAAGGTAAEAADHLLATKILRQIIDRPGTQASDVDELRQTIEEEARGLGNDAQLDRSLDVLRREKRRAEGMVM